MNYSYPPLLYQRGEEDEDEEEHEGECDDSEDEYNSHMLDEMDLGQLPQLHESDDLIEMDDMGLEDDDA